METGGLMIAVPRGMQAAGLSALVSLGCTAVDRQRRTARLDRPPPELLRCEAGNKKRMQALAAIQQYVARSRSQAAAEEPEAPGPALADSLLLLSSCLNNLGRQDEALSVSVEEVAVARQLAASRPTFESGLVMSLRVLSTHLYKQQRREEALEAIDESVRLGRQLLTQYSTDGDAELAKSLQVRSVLLSQVGREAE